LNDLYVSPIIAKALLVADPNFASNEKEAKTPSASNFQNRRISAQRSSFRLCRMPWRLLASSPAALSSWMKFSNILGMTPTVHT